MFIFKKRKKDNKIPFTKNFFPPYYCKYSINDWCSDNVSYCRELRIALSLHDWCKFAKQDFFPPLMEYLENLKIQKNLDDPDNLVD